MEGLYLYTALFLLVASGTNGVPQYKDQTLDSEGDVLFFTYLLILIFTWFSGTIMSMYFEILTEFFIKIDFMLMIKMVFHIQLFNLLKK